MKPYYSSPDGAIVVYHARWEAVVAAGLVPVREVALVHADPPYGIKLDTKCRRSAATKLPGGGHTQSRDFAPIVGDDKPFDPSGVLALNRPLVIWGGHLCQPALPRSPSWIFWDKREGMGEIDNGDGELAWTNLGGPIRRFPYMWSGVLRATNGGRPGSNTHLHPTEKPEALSAYVYRRAKLKPGALVFVPYMGSGPDLAACVAAGLRCIACEVELEYCRVAVGARLHAAPVANNAGLPLFANLRDAAGADGGRP